MSETPVTGMRCPDAEQLTGGTLDVAAVGGRAVHHSDARQPELCLHLTPTDRPGQAAWVIHQGEARCGRHTGKIWAGALGLLDEVREHHLESRKKEGADTVAG